MAPRRTSRINTKTVVTVALLALAAATDVTSAAKCYYPKKNNNTPSVDTPTVTEAPSVETPSVVEDTPSTGSSFPSQETTEAPATEAGSYETNPTSSGAEQNPDEGTNEDNEVTQGSSTGTQGSSVDTPSVDTPSTETQEGSSAQTQGSSAETPSTETQEGSMTQTQGSSTEESPSTTSNSTSSGDHASFGKVVSSGKCVKGDPSTYVTRDQIDWVWKNTMESYVPQFKNLIFDQLVTNKGKLSYCVRWDNDEKLTKATASKFQAMVEKQFNVWNRWLAGYECWPIDKIEVDIVGYAVKDKSIMDWSDDSLGTIYEGLLDDEGSPKCPDECYKHQGQAASADTSGCKGKPFDMSLWPSTKPGDGAIGTGGDWGQRVEVNDMLRTMDDENMMVLLHEMGHGFGLPEMYVDKNKPAGFPPCVMDDTNDLTDGDGWLVRSILENIKDRYSFGK